MVGVTMNKKMKILTIDEIVAENQITRSFYFQDESMTKAEPGQFAMLWVPLAVSNNMDFEIPDQIPMSISSTEGSRFSLTVRKCGKTTSELFNYKEGWLVGVTGPLGRGFTISRGRVLCIGGGIGIAPLILLMERFQGKEIHFVMGAKTKNELLFEKKLKDLCNSIYITTDDGSYGEKGFASDPVEKICEEQSIDQIYCCGPEIMMHKIWKASLKLGIPAQFSLERYMYCGLGLCGHCAMNGFLVCKDGPVFTSEELKNVKDFGVKKVDETGRKIGV